MNGLTINPPATPATFDETGYLENNPDVRRAVDAGQFRSGRHHFDVFGHAERRRISLAGKVAEMRAAKMARVRPYLRTDLPHLDRAGKLDFLTADLRSETRVEDTANVSSNGYDLNGLSLIERYPDGLVLDCGAGRRDVYYPNVINFEIVDYDSTDIIGVGEHLPFVNESMDAVISVAVLEHVRDPFACAREISRVLKPGGQLYCAIPFLQPYHGYPHHYFNATHQGIRRLFEDDLDITDVTVLPSTHPIWTVSWMFQMWSAALDRSTRNKFEKMTVRDLMRDPLAMVYEPFCAKLPMETQLHLASAIVLSARKPG